MAQPSRRQRGQKARNQLWKNGLIAAVAGGGLLVVASAVGGKHPFVATAVSMPAWWSLGFGVLLLLLHVAAKLVGKRRPSRIKHPASVPTSKTPQPVSAIKALIDQIERETLGADAPSPLSPLPTTSREPEAGPASGPVNPVGWNESTLTDLDPHHFVALCTALFKQSGFVVRLARQEEEVGVGEGGVTDIWLEAPTIPEPVAIVRCHAGSGSPVDVATIQKLQETILAQGLRWGACITLTQFTTPAMALAASFGIHVLDTHELQLLISRRTPAQQAELLEVLLEHAP